MRLKNKDYRERGEWLSTQEVEAILTALRDNTQNPLRNETLVLVMYRHALRVSEVCRLTWNHIDFVNRTITITRLKGSVSGVHYLESDELKKLTKLKALTTGKWCFETDGKPISRDTVHMLVERAGKQAGISFPVHPHMFRHTRGKLLADKGIDIRQIQVYLGHKNIANTAIYTAISPERLKGFGAD